MAKTGRQYIGIIGGFRNLDPAKADRAKQLAVSLGRELAKAGLGIVVYNSDDKSLEPHVVSGFAAALSDRDGAGAIRVRCAQSQRDSVLVSLSAGVGFDTVFSRVRREAEFQPIGVQRP